MYFVLLAGLILGAFAFWLKRRRPKQAHEDIKRRLLPCKKCGEQIAVKNVKLDQEISLRCDTCGSRAIYKAADLTAR